MSVPTHDPEYPGTDRRRFPRVIARRWGNGIDWLIGALLAFALFWTVGTVTGHSIGLVAAAWGVAVLIAAVVLHALDVGGDGD